MSAEDISKAELDFQIRDNWRLTAENALLMDENEKLRRYVRMFAATISCDDCPYSDDFDICSDTEVTQMSEECALYKELHALGIESPE